jgi:ketosteroid isomerase-like protein
VNYSVPVEPEHIYRLFETVGTVAIRDASELPSVLLGVYTAIVQDDFGAMGNSMCEDVELNICGFGPMDGKWRGRSAVVEATRRNFALVDGQRPEIERIICQADCVAVLLRESGVLKSTGQAYSIRAVQWFTFAEGKIRYIDEIAGSVLKTESD